jgi:hypothetical protein
MIRVNKTLGLLDIWVTNAPCIQKKISYRYIFVKILRAYVYMLDKEGSVKFFMSPVKLYIGDYDKLLFHERSSFHTLDRLL